MIGPAMAAAKEPGLEVPTPRVPAEVPRVRPPEKVEVPRPLTLRRFAMDAEPVVEALRFVIRPEKFPATALMSPVDSREPARRWPVTSRLPEKVEEAAPETVRVFVMVALPSLAWPVTSSPPAKVLVPRPFTL